MKQITLTMTGNSCDFTTVYPNPIILDPHKKYEAALLSLETYNSIPNITDKNNTFLYSVDNGLSWKSITLEKDAYELNQINSEIQRQMVNNDDYDKTNDSFFINISISRLSSVIEITNPSYKINFDIENSIGSILGFTKETLSVGYKKSPKIVDIVNVNSILVNVDIIQGSYVNGVNSHAIHVFSPSAGPGYKIRERPQPELIFYQVNNYQINDIRIWLTDQNKQLIDLQGERVTVTIAIREVNEFANEKT